jgi:hypothetical protein
MEKSKKGGATGSSASEAATKSGQTTPKKKPIDLKLVYAAIASELRERDIIPAEGEFREHWAFEQACEMFEIERAKLIPEYANAVEAATAFSEWIATTEHVFAEPQLFTVTGWTVTLTIPVQSGSVSLGVDFEPNVKDIDKVIQQVKRQLAETFNRNWTAPKKEIKQGSNGSSTDYKIEQVEIVNIRVEEKSDGALRYFAMPGKGPWKTYGIPLYKDVAEKMEIELPDEGGEYDWSAMIEYELKPDGKPRRVIGYVE